MMNRAVRQTWTAFLFSGVAVLIAGSTSAAQADTGVAAPLPMIHTDGVRFVDPAGNPVRLRGCNLGNYLTLESWMFGKTLEFKDGVHFSRTLRGRFGDDRAEHLIELYRNNWIEPRDFALIKSFGFNLVRLPFDYRLIQETRPPFAIRSDAFRWTDHAVQMAQDAGLYVILDLHGTPGGQSMEDHTGEAGQDMLWKSPEDQQRTVAVWRAMAGHYKDRTAVAGYDLINEPYGDDHDGHSEDVRPVLKTLLPQITQAIRAAGDQHVVFFPGALNGGIDFYGNPHEQGLTDVAFTEHYYPGLFGSTPALETQARVLNQELPTKEKDLQSIASPYYVGEFNVVLTAENPDRVMRAYYDRFADYGWAATMWSYKLISTKGGVGDSDWYAVTNAGPLPALDLDHSSYEQLEQFFQQLGTVALAPNEALRKALTTATPSPLYLPRFPTLPTHAPTSPPPSDPPGYTSYDLGETLPGYTAVQADGSVVVMAGGPDVGGGRDSCRFVAQPSDGDTAEVKATITRFVDTNEYAKAGVMARWGEPDRAGAAMALVNVFPDGTVALMTRAQDGGNARETKAAAGAALPIELRLSIHSGTAVGSYRSGGGAWQTIGEAPVSTDGQLRTGVALCAHAPGVLSTAQFSLGDAADAALATAAVAEPASLLTNGSFETAGSGADQAAGWNRWGDWLNRETGWSPTHSGSAEIGYHHWQITADNSSGLWQDVDVQPGKRYTFSIYAQHDVPDAAQHEATSVELRLESNTPDAQVTLNSKTFDVSKLASGQSWSRLSVSGTAQTNRLRVLVVANPSHELPRGGAVKLDDATLIPADDGQ